MGKTRHLLMIVAVASCGLFMAAQASFELSMMPGMDIACFSSCLDQAMHDVAAPSAVVFAAALAVIASAWAFAMPAFTSRFDSATAPTDDDRRRSWLSQRRE